MPAPVPVESLVSYFSAGRPKEGRAVGAEFELLMVDRRTRKEAPFGGPRGVEALLKRLLERGRDWRAVEGDGRIIGLERADGAAVTLEPGSQLELSTPPLPGALEIDADYRAFVRELRAAADGLDLVPAGIGLNPFSATAEVELGPKRRYGIMTGYLSRKGDLALDMMRRTLSVHVTFDYRDEPEVCEMHRTAFAVTPLVVAMFAHSPLERRAPNGFASYRWEVWHRTDPERCGILPAALERDSCFRRYAEAVLDLPLIFTLKGGVYRPAYGLPARKWFAGEWDGLEGHEGLAPEVDDLEWVINQSFRDVRLRRYLECRAADFPGAPLATAVPALWTGLLYDEVSRASAWELVAGLDLTARRRLSRDVAARGFAARAAGRDVLSLAKDLARISREGLVRRGLGEERLLDALDAQLATGKTPAETLLEKVAPFPADPDRLLAAIEL